MTCDVTDTPEDFAIHQLLVVPQHSVESVENVVGKKLRHDIVTI